MGRGQQQPQPIQQPDPLADLREESPPTDPPTDPANSEPEAVTIRPMVDQETWDAMVAEVVAAWHADTTSQGFLHGGGQCGCRYIARTALQVAVPVMTEEDAEQRELEPVE